MKHRILALVVPLLAALAVLPAAGGATEKTLLVEWGSGESAERLSRSSHKTDFFPLSNHFVSQDNKIFCGPVSSAIVLNALRLGRKEGLPRDDASIGEDERAWLPKGFDPFFGKYTPGRTCGAKYLT